jgi:hypothetical protein
LFVNKALTTGSASLNTCTTARPSNVGNVSIKTSSPP